MRVSWEKAKARATAKATAKEEEKKAKAKLQLLLPSLCPLAPQQSGTHCFVFHHTNDFGAEKHPTVIQ